MEAEVDQVLARNPAAADEARLLARLGADDEVEPHAREALLEAIPKLEQLIGATLTVPVPPVPAVPDAAPRDLETPTASNVVELVSQRYVDTVSQAQLYEKAARGLLEELNDPYTELLSPRDLKQFQSRTGPGYARSWSTYLAMSML